jgi:hypothetical protein
MISRLVQPCGYSFEAAVLGHPKARWLAAAYDRWLMYQGKPQKYGANDDAPWWLKEALVRWGMLDTDL